MREQVQEITTLKLPRKVVRERADGEWLGEGS